MGFQRPPHQLSSTLNPLEAYYFGALFIDVILMVEGVIDDRSLVELLIGLTFAVSGIIALWVDKRGVSGFGRF